MFSVPFLRKKCLGKDLVKLQQLSWALFGLLESYDLGPVQLCGFLAAPETALGIDIVKSWCDIWNCPCPCLHGFLCFPAPASKSRRADLHWTGKSWHCSLRKLATAVKFSFAVEVTFMRSYFLFKEQIQLVTSYLEALIFSLTGKWKIISKQDTVL